MKKIAKLGVAILAMSALSGAALAATPGAYLGLGAGYSQILQNNKYLFTGGTAAEAKQSGFTESESTGVAVGRAFGGYNFTQNFGVEAGYNYFGQTKVSASTKLSNAQLTNQLQDVDLVGKAYLPISNSGFNLYVLGGAAYVHSNVTLSGTKNVPDQGSNVTNAVRPKYGIGASYDIPDTQLTASLELSRIQGQGSQSSIPSSNTAMLTISYNFG